MRSIDFDAGFLDDPRPFRQIVLQKRRELCARIADQLGAFAGEFLGTARLFLRTRNAGDDDEYNKRCAHQSALAPESLTALPHLAISALI